MVLRSRQVTILTLHGTSIAALILSCAVTSAAYAQDTTGPRTELLGDLSRGWARTWQERDLGRGSTRYQVVLDEGYPVLEIHADGVGSMLWRTVYPHDTTALGMRWRWKIAQSLVGNDRERERQGDDYALRVFALFGTDVTELRRARVLCYVWANSEPAGSVYPSPYADNVAMIVVESGNRRAGQWVVAERDLAADFRRAFGEPPGPLRAVAVMTDTDDTGAQATGYLADLVLVARASSEP